MHACRQPAGCRQQVVSLIVYVLYLLGGAWLEIYQIEVDIMMMCETETADTTN